MPDRKPIKDLDILRRRPTCLIGDPSKTSTCFTGHRHAWSETHRRPTCPILFAYIYWNYVRTLSGRSVSNVSPIRHVCRSLIRHVGLLWVSDESPMGFRSGMPVSDGACQSQMGHVSLRWVSDEACRGLWWSISVFDGSPTRHIGFLCISDNNNFFVNSSWTRCVQDDWSIHIIYRFNPRSGDEDEDAEPENCAAPLTCKEKDLLRYYYYIHNGIATKYVAGNMNFVDTGTKETPRKHEILISLLPIYTDLIKTKYRPRFIKFNNQ